jgi:1-acyl-sn-glycerol-3-phosphate acyltransferase
MRLSFLPAPVRGAVSAALLALNTIAWCTPLFALSLLKLLLPFTAVRRRIDPLLHAIASGWIGCNGRWMALAGPTAWDVQGLESLQPGGWYLVNANHQSWVDILVLQKVLNGRIPMLKFFLKRELIWVPVIGLAWWALDFPFMRRHGREALRRNPALGLQDAAATRKACERFALVPTSVTNFAEGTRATPAKRAAAKSPYRHLLPPKAGALAHAMGALGSRFRSLLDVTIVYPERTPTFWDLLCGRVPTVVVRITERTIPPELFDGDAGTDPALRAQVARWLQDLWAEKDAQIDALLARDRKGAPAQHL